MMGRSSSREEVAYSKTEVVPKEVLKMNLKVNLEHKNNQISRIALVSNKLPASKPCTSMASMIRPLIEGTMKLVFKDLPKQTMENNGSKLILDDNDWENKQWNFTQIFKRRGRREN